MLGASLLGDVRETPRERPHITESDALLESEATYICDVRALNKVNASHKNSTTMSQTWSQITSDQIRPDQVMQLQHELAKLA